MPTPAGPMTTAMILLVKMPSTWPSRLAPAIVTITLRSLSTPSAPSDQRGANSCSNLVDRFHRQMRPDRQAEHRFGQPFGQRIGARALPQIGIGLLQMRRNRIVDQRPDPGFLQPRHQGGA